MGDDNAAAAAAVHNGYGCTIMLVMTMTMMMHYGQTTEQTDRQTDRQTETDQ